MPESENITEEDLKFEWMIRPCEMYIAEYKDCKSIKARFHQYFIFGETLDCKQWKIDYDNCYLWENYKSPKAYKELIESEKIRRFERLRGHYANDVWERRNEPPKNWNAPLPKWIEEKNNNSYLKCISDKLKKEQSNEIQKGSCTIM